MKPSGDSASKERDADQERRLTELISHLILDNSKDQTNLQERMVGILLSGTKQLHRDAFVLICYQQLFYLVNRMNVKESKTEKYVILPYLTL